MKRGFPKNPDLEKRVWLPKQTMKMFRIKESARLGITESAVSMRLIRGKYKHKIRISRENSRVVFVREAA